MEPKTMDEKLTAQLKSRYNSKQTDAEALKAKPMKMGNLINDLNEIPRKEFLVGPIGKTSVKESKKDENDIRGGDGKPMSGPGRDD